MGYCWRVPPVLTSSSTIVTSLITLLTASWASCFAAVFLTESLDPVSKSVRSLSNLGYRGNTMLLARIWMLQLFNYLEVMPSIGGPGRTLRQRAYLDLFTGGFLSAEPTFKSPLMICDFSA